jgi:hypothetical protein
VSTETSPAEKSPLTFNEHRVVDADFAAGLEERFGIPMVFILRSLEGEAHHPAIALCGWASRHEERNGTLLMLARKFGRGRARRQSTPGTPPRGRGQVSPEPSVDRSGRGHGTRRPGDVAPDRVATTPGGG